MNPDPFDVLLADFAKQPLPTAPQVRAQVWSEIAQRRRRPFWAGLVPTLDWSDLFLEPRLAVPALVLALMAGMLPGAVTRVEAHPDVVSKSLHFGVFSIKATGFSAWSTPAIVRPSPKT